MVGQSARVVLLGGKWLAIQVLERLRSMPGVCVAAVIPCADDDPDAERWYPSLARHAHEHGLPVLQPKSVNEESFFPVLRQLEPDLLLSVFYDKILKQHVLELPATGDRRLLTSGLRRRSLSLPRSRPALP